MVINKVLIKCEICGKESETEKLMESHKKNCVRKRIEIINNDTDGDLKIMFDKLLVLVNSNKEEMENLKTSFKILEEANKNLQSENKELLKHKNTHAVK